MGTVVFKTAGGSALVTLTSGAVVAAGASGYELVDYQLGSVQRRRDVDTSPYEDGETEITSVRGGQSITVTVRLVGASTWAQARALANNIISAAEQVPTWILDLSIGGASFSYLCRAADWSLTAPRDLLLQRRAEITLTIPVRTV